MCVFHPAERPCLPSKRSRLLAFMSLQHSTKKFVFGTDSRLQAIVHDPLRFIHPFMTSQRGSLQHWVFYWIFSSIVMEHEAEEIKCLPFLNVSGTFKKNISPLSHTVVEESQLSQCLLRVTTWVEQFHYFFSQLQPLAVSFLTSQQNQFLASILLWKASSVRYQFFGWSSLHIAEELFLSRSCHPVSSLFCLEPFMGTLQLCFQERGSGLVQCLLSNLGGHLLVNLSADNKKNLSAKNILLFCHFVICRSECHSAFQSQRLRWLIPMYRHYWYNVCG